MALVSRIRPRVGDVIEVQTRQGLAYAHYTHKHDRPPHWGALLRVLPGLLQERPAEFTDLVQQAPQFSTFFPLGAACNRRIVQIVANEPVGVGNRSFPTFRNSHRDRDGKRVGAWFLWNGVREWKVPELSPQQLREYPPLQICNDTALVDLILQGWRHEDDA
jgi:hypothetical protein